MFIILFLYFIIIKIIKSDQIVYYLCIDLWKNKINMKLLNLKTLCTLYPKHV